MCFNLTVQLSVKEDKRENMSVVLLSNSNETTFRRKTKLLINLNKVQKHSADHQDESLYASNDETAILSRAQLAEDNAREKVHSVER